MCTCVYRHVKVRGQPQGLALRLGGVSLSLPSLNAMLGLVGAGHHAWLFLWLLRGSEFKPSHLQRKK